MLHILQKIIFSPLTLRQLRSRLLLALSLVALLLTAPGAAAPLEKADGESVFLVATENLDGSPFAHTVILMTHFGGRGGTTGLAINRPSKLTLREAFPRITRLRSSPDVLYLGGPVGTKQVFVLLRTRQPKQGMMHLIDDIYFVPGYQVLSEDTDGDSRAYAGYVGWAPGQLQAEIDRGDWRVVRHDPAIVFEKDTSVLWPQLSKRWSGNWI